MKITIEQFYRQHIGEILSKSEGHFFQNACRPILTTLAGNIMFGSILTTVTALIDIFHRVYYNELSHYSVYGFAFLFTAIGVSIANRLLDLSGRVEHLNHSLKDRVDELRSVNDKLIISRARYKNLIEESDDLIFSLDENWHFTMANRAFARHLGLQSQEIIGREFWKFIHDPQETKWSYRLIRDRLEKAAEKQQSVYLKIPLWSRFVTDGKEFQCRIEFVDGMDGNEILGKASAIIEDGLLPYLVQEHQVFEIGNHLYVAEDLSQRLVRNLERYIDQTSVAVIRIGLREIIVNAIEHGNLGITYDEKTMELERGNYRNFIASRQKQPEYMHRKVRIEYRFEPDILEYHIIDEGSGFDHANELKANPDFVNRKIITHGRGMILARNSFDEIIYNDRGNSVILRKHIKPQ